MTDLSAYRERVPAVMEYERTRGFRGALSDLERCWRVCDLADAALAALAEALGEAEATIETQRRTIQHQTNIVNMAEADVRKWKARQRATEQKLGYEEKLRGQAEAINDQWEVKAADLMRERNEARAETHTEILDSAWNTANERSERLAAELAELKARRCEVVVLPDYETARTAKDPSPLDLFVVENEPAGMLDETTFRRGLQEVVEWLTTTGRYERREG